MDLTRHPKTGQESMEKIKHIKYKKIPEIAFHDQALYVHVIEETQESTTVLWFPCNRNTEPTFDWSASLSSFAC